MCGLHSVVAQVATAGRPEHQVRVLKHDAASTGSEVLPYEVAIQQSAIRLNTRHGIGMVAIVQVDLAGRSTATAGVDSRYDMRTSSKNVSIGVDFSRVRRQAVEGWV